MTGKSLIRFPALLSSFCPLSSAFWRIIPAFAGIIAPRLLYDRGDDARTDGAAAFTNGEAETLLHGDRHDQLDRHRDVVAGHDHLGALGKLHHAGHVGRPEVELRTIIGEERSMAT